MEKQQDERIYNQFILYGELLNFEARESAKGNIWGYGNVSNGTGRYKRYFNILAFKEIAEELAGKVGTKGEFKGKLTKGWGDKKYETTLTVNEYTIDDEVELEEELPINTEELPF